jgi:hypothetical protein
VPVVKQELLTLLEQLSSSPLFSWVRFAGFVIFYVVLPPALDYLVNCEIYTPYAGAARILIKLASCLPMFGGSLLGTPASSTTKTGHHDIAESGIKHNKIKNQMLKRPVSRIMRTTIRSNVLYNI